MKCNCEMIRVSGRKKRQGQKTGRALKPLYKLWACIRSRCKDGTVHGANPSYSEIKISKEWADSFDAFEADMGDKPSARHSIDRKDNLHGYCKHNCRWATSYEQSTNRRVPNLSIEKGISRKGKKYLVRVYIPKQEKQLGVFDSLDEARAVLKRALVDYEKFSPYFKSPEWNGL